MTMKNTLSICAALILIASGINVRAQNSLQFSQAIIVGNSLQTVPSGKVCKVTSVYGFESNLCVTGAELNNCNYGGANSVNMSVSAFKVNGVTVLSECNLKRIWQGSTCSGSTNNTWANVEQYCGAGLGTLGYAQKSANPNVLPMWLPAGTTLRSDGPNTFLSVIEFDVVP